MPAISILNSALVTVQGKFDNNDVVNVFCYQHFPGPPTNADIIGLAVWWGNNGWAAMRQILSTAYSLYLIRVRNVHTGATFQYDISPTGTQLGVLGSDPLPGQNAAVVSWRTSVSARYSRGRSFIGPLPENQVTTNYINTALINLYASWAAYMISTTPDGDWDFAVGSRKYHASNPINAFAIDRVVDSMDRRKPGRGT
jgi:hypothetical protein